MKQAYIIRTFSSATQALVDKANEIIEEYEQQGFTLTLRQLYYQFVARDVIANTLQSYKRLGDVVNNARMAGLIDWDAIEDRTRNLRRPTSWDSPAQIMHSATVGYRLDRWVGQSARPEVWIEKDALVGIIANVCEEWQVPYFACRGYNSQSEQWAAGQRFRRALAQGLQPVVLHLGDHDPSGLDMSRDNSDRLCLFAEGDVPVHRLALNWDQVQQFSPPPNPAKATDARYADYEERFGSESWELDALEPRVIESLVSEAIREVVDMRLWEQREALEEADKAQLAMLGSGLRK